MEEITTNTSKGIQGAKVQTKYFWYARNVLNLFIVCVRLFFYCLLQPKKLFELFFSIFSTLNEFYQVSHGRLYDFKKTVFYQQLKNDPVFLKCNLFEADSIVTRPFETEIMAAITHHLKPVKIFEIGTYNGFTALHLAYNSPKNCIVYTLDLPPDHDIKIKEKTTKYSYDDLLVIELSLKNVNNRIFKNDPIRTKIVELFGDSSKFDFSSYYGKIDLVFIDGNHSYPYVRSDTENALKMLSDQGVIIWHDFDYIIHRDVFKYLNRLVKTYKIYSISNTRFAIYGKQLI